MSGRSNSAECYAARSGLRIRRELEAPDNPHGIELKCMSCARNGDLERYWPLTPEFWKFYGSGNTLAQCRACLNRKARERRRHDTERQRSARRAYEARYYRENREYLLRQQKEARERRKERLQREAA